MAPLPHRNVGWGEIALRSFFILLGGEETREGVFLTRVVLI